MTEASLLSPCTPRRRKSRVCFGKRQYSRHVDNGYRIRMKTTYELDFYIDSFSVSDCQQLNSVP